MVSEETPLTEKDEIVLHAIFNPNTPLDFNTNISLNYKQSVSNEDKGVTAELKNLEIEAIKLAQAGNFADSLQIFDQLIREAPTYASAYNNRAQLFRIQGNNDSAMKDLNNAILVSESKGIAASQAFVQRAILFKLSGDDQKALNDFKCAAELGSPFAKSQLIALNPYAALCNKMLGEVFCKLYNADETLN